MAVNRFGVSLESDLLEALDEFVQANKFPNRSQAIRYLIEKNIVEHKWQCNNVVAGAIVLIYNFRKTDLQARLTDVQSGYRDCILSSQQYFLTDEKMLVVISAKGPSYKLTELADTLIALKGIEHGKLIMSKV